MHGTSEALVLDRGLSADSRQSEPSETVLGLEEWLILLLLRSVILPKELLSESWAQLRRLTAAFAVLSMLIGSIALAHGLDPRGMVLLIAAIVFPFFPSLFHIYLSCRIRSGHFGEWRNEQEEMEKFLKVLQT